MIDFAKNLLISTGKYVASGIVNDTNRRFYNAEVTELLAHVSRATDLATCKVSLTERRMMNGQRRYPISFFTSPKQYTLLATDHALDIVDCLEKRFVTGDERTYFIKKVL